MKIYFIGSHSSGKSTCARYVSDKYKLPMITEVARAILSEKELQLDTLRSNLDVVDEYQNSIFYRQLAEEKKYNSFVSDRSFDCLAYSAQHSRIFSKLMKDPEFEQYIAKLKESDSIIFFVRPSKATLKPDGVREALNWDGVVAIDAMVKVLIQMFDLRHFTINTDNMQERTQLIDNVLSLTTQLNSSKINNYKDPQDLLKLFSKKTNEFNSTDSAPDPDPLDGIKDFPKIGTYSVEKVEQLKNELSSIFSDPSNKHVNIRKPTIYSSAVYDGIIKRDDNETKIK